MRLQRFLQDVKSFQRLVGDDAPITAFQLQIARAFITVFTTLFITSGVIFAVEAQPNDLINNYFDAFYFSVTTLTTVGFGDIVPVTPLGRATIVAVIVAGRGIIPF